MIPLKDDNPTRRFPWLTVALIAANVGVFGFEWSLDAAALGEFFLRFGHVPAEWLADPTSPPLLSAIVTSMFVHAGIVHLAGNMLYLWIFGNNVEDRLGAPRFAAFYVVCGTVAALAQTWADPGSSIPLVGASGAVAGILGAYVVLYPRATVLTVIPIVFYFEVARLPAFLVIGFWFLLQLANGITALDPAMAGGVAWFAHLGGFAAGVLLALPLRRDRRRAWR